MANEDKKPQLERFYDLVEGIEVAMFTTRRSDGLLVSRPMANQVRSAGADLWFVTSKDSPKIAELQGDGNVNLAYYKDRTREWVSVAGVAHTVTDKAKIAELYRPDWKAWFGDEGGERDGSASDPRIILIAVDIKLAMFLEINKPQPVVLFELVKGMLTGNPPDLGHTETLSKM